MAPCFFGVGSAWFGDWVMLDSFLEEFTEDWDRAPGGVSFFLLGSMM